MQRLSENKSQRIISLDNSSQSQAFLTSTLTTRLNKPNQEMEIVSDPSHSTEIADPLHQLLRNQVLPPLRMKIKKQREEDNSL